MAEAKKVAIISVRRPEVFVTPPMPMIFSNLVKPDLKEALKAAGFQAEPAFNATFEVSPAAKERMIAKMDPLAAQLMPVYLKELQDAGIEAKGLNIPSAEEWLDDHLRAAREKSKTQLPTMSFEQKAFGVRLRDKEPFTRKMVAWSATDALLDLNSLKIGMGSTCQAVLSGGLWSNKTAKWQPSFTFKLIGIKILILKTYEGHQAAPGEIDEDDLALLGDEFNPEDLSAYVTGNKPTAAPHDEDLDDESPF